MEKIRENQNSTTLESPTKPWFFAVNDNEAFEISIPVPWGHIAGRSWGNSSKKPVLAIHGWMDNAGSFDRLIPLLSNEMYIIAVDMPGHGKSSHLPPGAPYHFIDFIISLRRIVDYFKWSQFSWLGHSMGAALGSLYASYYPNEVQELIMLDLVMPATRPTGEDYAARTATAIDYFLKLDSKIEPTPPSYTYETALLRLMSASALSLDGAKALMSRGAFKTGVDKWSFSRDLRLRSPSIVRLSNEQCYKILGKIRCKLLIIKGSAGFINESSDEFKDIIKIYETNCALFRYIEVEGKHHVHLDDPEKCATLINDFLK